MPLVKERRKVQRGKSESLSEEDKRSGKIVGAAEITQEFAEWRKFQ